jgi:hypothetical protein
MHYFLIVVTLRNRIFRVLSALCDRPCQVTAWGGMRRGAPSLGPKTSSVVIAGGNGVAGGDEVAGGDGML